MKHKRKLPAGLSVGLLVILCSGCEGVSPKRVKIGAVVREARGNYGLFESKKIVPLYRVQFDYDNYYLRFDYNEGELNNRQYGFPGRIMGEMLALGGGVSYPLSENAGLGLGGEIFNTDFTSKNRFFGLESRVDESVLGWGLNVEVSGKLPLDERISAFGSVGYNFTDNESKHMKVDFDGSYFCFGLSFEVGK